MLHLPSHLVHGPLGAGEGDLLGEPEDEGLGKLEVFCGVSEFPVRVKCASLPWRSHSQSGS
jgi:NifU-like protein involved in Fe-S cluster formation